MNRAPLDQQTRLIAAHPLRKGLVDRLSEAGFALVRAQELDVLLRFGFNILLERNERWVFFEDFLCSEERGVIACAEILPDGSLSPAERALEEKHHLSFPFLFRHEGEIFMIPECRRSGDVCPYRATAVSCRLKKISAVDTVLCYRDGLYWLFTAVRVEPAEPSELWLFHAQSLFGEWTYHPANPISSDARRIRNGGAIFLDNDRWIRPSQDCSVGYGYALGLNEITRLDPLEYAEVPRAVISPSGVKGCRGIHTYNRDGDIEVSDGNFPRH